MTFTIPNIFIAGKKAIAYDVNENFDVIKKELIKHSETLSETSLLLEKTREYIDEELREELINLVKLSKVNFCANFGNVDEQGNASLLAIDGINTMRIVFKVGDGEDKNLANLVYTNHNSEQTIRASLSPVEMNGKEDGTYNIFGKITGAPYALKNKIFKTKHRPELEINDIWLNTSCFPIKAVKFDGVKDVEFNDVPLGEATINKGELASVVTLPYNQNGYDVNIYTQEKNWTNAFPGNKYINLTIGASGASYTAPANGWYLHTYSAFNQNNFCTFVNQNNQFSASYRDYSNGSLGGAVPGCAIPCKKGDIIKHYYGNIAAHALFRFIYAEGES